MADPVYFPSPQQIAASDRLLLHVEGRFLCASDDRLLFRLSELESYQELINSCFLVARDAADSILAIDLARDISAELGAESRSLRSLLYLENQGDMALAGAAHHILDWYRTHRFCGACGTGNELHESERVMRCPGCGLLSFPRINPCAIVLVTRGREMLLARSARRSASFYSCLAGFIEIGETPEQTVLREVQEEVGIKVKNIRYVKSQPWPFPSQLMIGFRAEYDSGEIVLEDEEIADAKWFSAAEFPPIPSSRISVAGELIEGFVAEVKAGKL